MDRSYSLVSTLRVPLSERMGKYVETGVPDRRTNKGEKDVCFDVQFSGIFENSSFTLETRASEMDLR